MQGVVVNRTLVLSGIRTFFHAVFTYVLPIVLPLCFFWFDYLDQRSELLQGRNWWGDDPCFNISVYSEYKIGFLLIYLFCYIAISFVSFFILRITKSVIIGQLHLYFRLLRTGLRLVTGVEFRRSAFIINDFVH